MDRYRSRFLVAAAAILVACGSDEPTSVPSPRAPEPAEALLRDVPAVVVGLRPTGDDAGISAVQLALENAGGEAIVAFKAAASPRIAEIGGRRARVLRDDARAALAMLRESGYVVEEVYGALGMARVRIPPGRADELRRHPLVDFVEASPGVTLNAFDSPAVGGERSRGTSQLMSATLAAQQTPWNVSFVNAPSAWAYSTGANSPRVMLIGHGIYFGHEDLPAVLSGACGGMFNACGSDWSNGNLELGIMAARNNSLGVVGIAPGLPAESIFVWRVVAYPTSWVDWPLVISGFNQAIPWGIKIVAIGGIATADYSPSLATAIATAWNAGIITVAGVGTGGYYLPSVYPASYPNVVGVSGVRDNGTFAGYPTAGCGTTSSNWGPMVDLAAPIYATSTTRPQYGNGYVDTRDWEYCSPGMSAAHVAGVVTLIRSRFRLFTPQQVVNRLLSTSSHPGSQDPYIGYGIPNAYAAVAVPTPVLSSIPTNPNPPRRYTPFTMTINGTGFAPELAEIVYSMPCYPPGQWCSSVYPNSSLTTKTATQLVITNWVFGVTGELRIQVRNGTGAPLSNIKSVTIVM